MEEFIKYPIGEQDFKNIRSGGYVYIDKTSFIATILNDGGKYYFLARPRRFGKSLFLSTLQYFFEGHRELFKGLFIDSTDWDWESYPVLRLDLNKERYLETDKLDSVLDKIFRDWEEKYEVDVKDINPAQRFETIIQTAHRKTGRQVVVLVDEYDKPLVGNLNINENFEIYRSKLAALYSNFKSSAEHLRFVFITGVSRFSKLSVFSDLNNINDITFDDKFSDICGITASELTDNLRHGVMGFATKYNISFEEAIGELKSNYDGYRFSEYGSEIFNPWSVLNALGKLKIEYYWNETGVPTVVAETLNRINANLESFFNVYCPVEDLKGLDLLNPNPIALLYQTGYLTIKNYDTESQTFHLAIPNKEVKLGLYKVLVPYYVKTHQLPGNQLIEEITRNFIFGDPDSAMKNMQTFFAGIDYAMRIENENNFHNAFFLLIHMMGLKTDTKSHTSDGRIDIEIKTKKYIYIIELKYDRSAEEALRQIQEKHYARKYQMEPHLIFEIGVEFSSKTRCIENWKIHKI